ncbi:uncharacterized protein LOC143191051 [Rhynchophorus ferrugineus]|uniref:uncharacterized protein LOC143191051 n=1 Tax=Rhynchophorus ferrugineus TaxID=354439 RepID=UPI003FCDA1D1
MSEPENWTHKDKSALLMALKTNGDTDLTAIQRVLSHKSITDIRMMIDYYKRRAQTKWLNDKDRKNDEIKNWIDIFLKIDSQQQGHIHDIIPRVLKYIALFEKNSEESDIKIRELYYFLSEISYGNPTKELPERTEYFLNRCLAHLAENLQKQDIEESKNYLRNLPDLNELIKNVDKSQLNPLQIPKHLLKLHSVDLENIDKI